eukprot:1258238-Amorphochlora_amoeboformis.AAC.4
MYGMVYNYTLAKTSDLPHFLNILVAQIYPLTLNPKRYAPGGLSEDCLYLSIWTPPSATTRYSCGKNDSKIPGDPSESRHISSELLPVYLFFYGGSYVEGAGA